MLLSCDGWTITDDPLKLTIGSRSLYVDLGASKLLAAQKKDKKIGKEKNKTPYFFFFLICQQNIISETFITSGA